MNLAQVILVWRGLDAFVKERRAQEAKNKTRLAKKTAELMSHHIYDYAIFELAIHTFDTVVGEMPLSISASTQGEISSWENTILRNSVKDCRKWTGTWILSQWKKVQEKEKSQLWRHMAKPFQKMILDLSWEEPFHQNGQWIYWHLANSLGNSNIWMTSWLPTANSGNLISNIRSWLRWQEDCPASHATASTKIMSATITTVMVVAATDNNEIMDAEVADKDTEDAAVKIMTTTII
jgi:hypothetical protein